MPDGEDCWTDSTAPGIRNKVHATTLSSMASTPGTLLLLLVVLAGTMVTIHCQVDCTTSIGSCSSALASSTGGSASLEMICQATLTCLEKLSSSCMYPLRASIEDQVALVRNQYHCGAGSVGVSLLTTVVALLAAILLRP